MDEEGPDRSLEEFRVLAVQEEVQLVTDIASNMSVQVRNDPIIAKISNTEDKAAMAKVCDTLLEYATNRGALACEDAWYNDDSHFKLAVNEVI